MECVGVDRDGARVFRHARLPITPTRSARTTARWRPIILIIWWRCCIITLGTWMRCWRCRTSTSTPGRGSTARRCWSGVSLRWRGAWHPWFAEAAAAGTARIDGSGAHQPNDAFFSAVFKHVQALTRRGCPPAALECAKLALSLWTDPIPRGCCAAWITSRFGAARRTGSWTSPPISAETGACSRSPGSRTPPRSPGSPADDPGVSASRGSTTTTAARGRGRRGARGKTPSKLTAEERAEADDALLAALLAHPAAAKALVARLDASAAASDPRWVAALTHPHFADARDSLGNPRPRAPLRSLCRTPSSLVESRGCVFVAARRGDARDRRRGHERRARHVGRFVRGDSRRCERRRFPKARNETRTRTSPWRISATM